MLSCSKERDSVWICLVILVWAWQSCIIWTIQSGSVLSVLSWQICLMTRDGCLSLTEYCRTMLYILSHSWICRSFRFTALWLALSPSPPDKFLLTEVYLFRKRPWSWPQRGLRSTTEVDGEWWLTGRCQLGIGWKPQVWQSSDSHQRLEAVRSSQPRV